MPRAHALPAPHLISLPSLDLRRDRLAAVALEARADDELKQVAIGSPAAGFAGRAAIEDALLLGRLREHGMPLDGCTNFATQP